MTTLQKRWLVMGMALLSLGLAQRWFTPVASSPLSPSAQEALLQSLVGPVGEYAAYATYDAVLQKYGPLEPYTSILRSEANHIAALQRQLDKYGIPYPQQNPYLGQITLPANLQDIALAEAQTEIDNAAMYDRLVQAVEGYVDLVRVFGNLRSASLEVHLPMFKAAATYGGSLTLEQMQNLRH